MVVGAIFLTAIAVFAVVQKPFTICGGAETIHHLRWCRNHSPFAVVQKPFTIELKAVLELYVEPSLYTGEVLRSYLKTYGVFYLLKLI